MNKDKLSSSFTLHEDDDLDDLHFTLILSLVIKSAIDSKKVLLIISNFYPFIV